LSWSAASARLWLFCSSATIRKVMMVVQVLMMSCHVSMSPMTKYDGAQRPTSSTQKVKNHARAKSPDALCANRSKNPIDGLTSEGMCAFAVFVIVLLNPANDAPPDDRRPRRSWLNVGTWGDRSLE
jgi:hypothetical protein